MGRKPELPKVKQWEVDNQTSVLERNKTQTKEQKTQKAQQLCLSFFFGPALKYEAGPTINQLIRITWERRRKDGRQEKQEKNKCDQ